MKTLKKEFTSLFYRMSVTRDRAEVWRDIVFLWAAAINNRVHYKQKIEDAYLAIIQKYTSVPFPVSWTVKMKKKQKETQDILSYHTQAAGCSDKARAKASGGRQPIEECGRTGL